MDTQEMRKEIVAAIGAGEYTKKDLDPVARGKYAGVLFRGGRVGDRKVEEMHGHLLHLRASRVVSVEVSAVSGSEAGMAIPTALEANTVSVVSEKVSEMETLRREVDALKALVSEKVSEIETLRREVDALKASSPPPSPELLKSVSVVSGKEKGGNVMGWSLGSSGSIWYAVKKIPKSRKNKTIYIGRDRTKAKEKIEAWLSKHPEYQCGFERNVE